MSLEVFTDSDAQMRFDARARVSREANDGRPPHLLHSKDDLDWAFSTEGERKLLASLEAKAAAVQRERVEAEERQAQARDLAAMTKQILNEWDEQERRERHEKARAEARRRLGLAK